MESLRAYAAHSLRVAARCSAPKRRGKATGFTLIELLVVLAIIAIILGIAFTSQNSFNNTLILANTAYDVGLTFTSAETYGISSRGAGANASTGYGLHFSAGTTGSFIFFADSYPPIGSSGLCHPPPSGDAYAPDAKPGNCTYDPSNDVTVNTYNLNNGITIANFCVHDSSTGSWSCAASNGSTLSSADVVFSRPNPDPFISANGGYSPSYDEMCLALAAPSGNAERFVSIYPSGEIDPNATSCP